MCPAAYCSCENATIDCGQREPYEKKILLFHVTRLPIRNEPFSDSVRLKATLQAEVGMVAKPSRKARKTPFEIVKQPRAKQLISSQK